MKMRKGGMATNIIVFLILFSFGIAAYHYDEAVAVGATNPFTAGYQEWIGAVTTNLFTFSLSNLLVIGGAVAIIGTLFFPNPYTIFLGVCAAIIGVALPGGAIYTTLSTQSGVPEPLLGLLRDILSAVLIFAIIAWYAGRDTW